MEDLQDEKRGNSHRLLHFVSPAPRPCRLYLRKIESYPILSSVGLQSASLAEFALNCDKVHREWGAEARESSCIP